MKKIKILGLMLTRDDIDMLDDWLTIHKKYFDKIFCLDGSLEFKIESKNILLKHNVIYLHDHEYPNLIKNDHSLRKLVFEKIKYFIKSENKLDEFDYWIVLIHPDEFYLFNIKNIINLAYTKKSNLIKFNSCPNAPQKREVNEWKNKKTYKIFKHFLFPGHIEDRIFKYNENLYYDNITHSNVLPHELDKKNTFNGGKIIHYKIYNLELFTKHGETKNSCWSSIKSHYPKNHKFIKLESFIINKPSGKYKKNKMFIIDNNYFN
jgi:hypothetical protein